MKKIIFIVAFGAAGLMSAKNTTAKKVIKKAETIEKKAVNHSKVSQKTKAIFYNWIQVISPCGAVYYLEASDYDSVGDFTDDVIYFNAQKCGTSYPLA
ncbi:MULTISPECIES: hypothetical protein [unclassified Chryseobacterium]|uniref:hypothetical protein n=1 Tax=unclassified Chryseobacterium TaxID=2593645 RepID=UPI001AE6765C|nr:MULTISPECIES: hypothetical protein [unclassified Chryseobacterium]MBP1163791.1 hypothetical protein [Chryseobacterium sp. PvR013]MDR4891864.1 hypothetical protein [Chryseobacterium sp. CFS7]